MAVQHHLDQPLMHINEIDISPGFETQVLYRFWILNPSKTFGQIAVSPTLYTTTEAAKTRFTPEERGCYSDREVMLKHLPYGMYRSGMRSLTRWHDDEDAPGMTSGTVCSRRRMTRFWTSAAAPPTTTGAWWTCPPSSKRDHSAK